MDSINLLTVLASIVTLGIVFGSIVLYLYFDEDKSGDKGKYHKSMNHYRDGDNT